MLLHFNVVMFARHSRSSNSWFWTIYSRKFNFNECSIVILLRCIKWRLQLASKVTFHQWTPSELNDVWNVNSIYMSRILEPCRVRNSIDSSSMKRNNTPTIRMFANVDEYFSVWRKRDFSYACLVKEEIITLNFCINFKIALGLDLNFANGIVLGKRIRESSPCSSRKNKSWDRLLDLYTAGGDCLTYRRGYVRSFKCIANLHNYCSYWNDLTKHSKELRN